MAPRYTYLSPGTQSFEFPIVADRSRHATAHLALAADDFKTAITRALEWCSHYKPDDWNFYPQVSYRGRRVLVKRIDKGNICIENNSMAKWVPIEAVAR